MKGDRSRVGVAAARLLGGAGLGLLAAAGWGWLAAPAGAAPQTGETGPAEAASQPASEPFILLETPAVEPALRDITRAATVEQALAYTDRERTILDDVLDGDGQVDANGLYVLLRRAEMLPEGRQPLTEADRPNVKNLWAGPAPYRGRLVRVEGRFVKTDDWSDQVTATQWWGTRGVWMVHIQELSTGEYRAMIVMLTRRPPVGLRPGRRLQFAGLFYKLVTLPESKETGDPSKTHEYPVIVASAVYAGGGETGTIIPQEALLMFGVIVLLLVAFMFLRRLANRRREGAASRYRPRRYDPAGPGEGGPDAARGVDEELIRQVEALRRQERKAGDAEDAGESNDPR